MWVGARRCVTSRELLKHHQKCQNPACPVCTPVKQYVQKQRLAMQQQQERIQRTKQEAFRAQQYMVRSQGFPAGSLAFLWCR